MPKDKYPKGINLYKYPLKIWSFHFEKSSIGLGGFVRFVSGSFLFKSALDYEK